MNLSKRVCTVWRQTPQWSSEQFFNQVLCKTASMIADEKTDGIVIFYEDKKIRYRFFTDELSANEWLTFYADLVNSSNNIDLILNLDKIYIEDHDQALPENHCQAVDYKQLISQHKEIKNDTT